MSRAACIASVFALGVVLMLAASPAAAVNTCQYCSCESSDCGQTCMIGPFDPECPECNQATCGEMGRCIGGDDCDTGCVAASCTSTLNGTSGGDTLTGNSNHQCINGFGGADTISGEAGDDTISAGDGNDTAYGGSGSDCLYGDGGDDNLTGDTGAYDYADGGAGTDTCDAETEVNCEF